MSQTVSRTRLVENLILWMEVAGTYQKKLALDAGLAETAVRDIIAGKSPDPGILRMTKIARALGCTLNDLVSDRPFPEAKARPILDGLTPENAQRLLDIAVSFRAEQELARLKRVLISEHISGVPSE